MVNGVSHVTFAVRDLDRALTFYRDALGFRLRARWDRGAYLDAGATWICLEVDGRAGMAPFDDGHVAFAVAAADFAPFAARLRASGARRWKENRSEGDSLYVEDPDQHRLEIHVGDLETRLAWCRQQPYDGMVIEDVPRAPRPFIW